jgi:transposase-like protein
MKFTNICAMLAARNCVNSGKTVAEVAKEAGVSVSTIYRWIRLTGYRR